MSKFSRTFLEKLGKRLRDAEKPADEDLRDLSSWKDEHEEPLRNLRELILAKGLGAPGWRLKNKETIIEKLRRESFTLPQIQDIAGLRLTVEMNLPEQRID